MVAVAADERWPARPIMAALYAKIASGDYPAGTQLPDPAELAAAYGVRAVFARLALAGLGRDGLVAGWQTGNAVVSEQPVVHRYGVVVSPRLKSDAGHRGLVSGIGRGGNRAVEIAQVTEIGRVPAPAFAAGGLGVAEGNLVNVRRRITTLDRVTCRTADSYFTIATSDRTPDLLAGPGADNHLKRISSIAPLVEFGDETTVRMPTESEMARLQITESTPVFVLIRTHYTSAGPLDVTGYVTRVDMNTLQYADMKSLQYLLPVPD